MATRDDLLRLETFLAEALTAADPVEALARPTALPAELQSALGAVDPDGLRIAVLLVARLRFEKLIQGSALAGEWWERDAREFTLAFRRYHYDVAPGALDPRDEAAAFDCWWRQQE